MTTFRRDLLHALATDTRSALGWGLRQVARVGDWLLGPQLDDVVCRLSRELDDDEEFCDLCFAGIESSEHLTQACGEGDR